MRRVAGWMLGLQPRACRRKLASRPVCIASAVAPLWPPEQIVSAGSPSVLTCSTCDQNRPKCLPQHSSPSAVPQPHRPHRAERRACSPRSAAQAAQEPREAPHQFSPPQSLRALKTTSH